MSQSLKIQFNPLVILTILLSASALIRGILIFSDVKLLYSDGAEYFYFSQQFYENFSAGKLKDALLLPVVGHWGGILLGVLPFFIHSVFITPEQMSAMFFAIPGVVNIYLLYLLSMRLFNDQRAALYAAFFYSISVSSIFNVRFVLLTEMSLMFFLVSILITLKKDRDNYLYISFLSGMCCFAIFFTYYGYWILTALALFFSSIYRENKLKPFLYSGIATSFGFFIPLVAFFLILYSLDSNWFASLSKFSTTVRQGDYADGYRIPFEFLYYSEGPFLFVALAALLHLLVKRDHENIKWIVWPLIVAYGLFVFFANILEHFVVLGRHVKQLIPFLCLITGLFFSRQAIARQVFLSLLCLFWFLYQYRNIYISNFHIEKQMLVEKYQDVFGDNQENYVLSFYCEPHPEKCDPAPENCELIDVFFMGFSLPMYQYDSWMRSSRQDASGYRVYTRLFYCP